MSLLTPLALALGALAIPIVLLYMLRLRRTETPISSTFLWRQLVRDREANAPWQRLRFSWLLLLQLLILAALVLALARPFTEVKTITTGRIVLLLDASASMRATDVDPDRFAAAQDIGLDLVDALGPDDTMTVIRVADVPEVLAAASRDKQVLRRAIRGAAASAVSGDWLAAMTLAAAGAAGVDELKVVIVTDGGLPADLPPVPGEVRLVSVGSRAANLAVSALATAALPGKPPQLFARISNYGSADADVILSVRLNGSDVIYDARSYTVPAQGQVDLFDLALPDDFDTVSARLTLPARATTRDYLALDNAAYAVRGRGGAGRVLLVSADNIFLEQVLRSLRGVELFQVDPADPIPTEGYDLTVLDGVLPDPLPGGDLLLINPPRGAAYFEVSAPIAPQGPVTVHAEDPRARNLGPFLEAVSLRALRPLTGVEWATVLAQVDGHPLVAAGEVDGRQVAILPFDARYPNTDLVLQPGWPILMAELAAWFSPPRVTDVSGSVRPGAPVAVRFLDGAESARVTRPDGGTTTLRALTSQAIFADTGQAGLYTVALRRGSATLRTETFAVNLFDPQESRIAPRSSVTLGTTTVAEGARQASGRQEWWMAVAALGLILLAGEWLLYHRSLRRLPSAALPSFGMRGPGGRRGRWGRWRRPEGRAR